MKNRIKLTESQLRRVIKESVKKVIKESSEDRFPWRNNPNCKTVEDMIEWGKYCSDKFESGEWSIHNFLCDLDMMANGVTTYSEHEPI